MSRDWSQGWSILFTAKWLLLFSARPPFAVEPETGCNCNTTNPRWRTTVARAVQRQRWAWTKLLFWLMQLERRIFSICHMLRPIRRRLLLNQVHCGLLKMNSLATNICTVSLSAALGPDMDLNFWTKLAACYGTGRHRIGTKATILKTRCERQVWILRLF